MAGVTTFVLSFRKEFAPAILKGKKAQTIRAIRKDGRLPRSGDSVKLFIGMRTKQCKMLGVAQVTDCFPVYMDLQTGHYDIAARGVRLNFREMEEFAEADGFVSAVAMLNWFRRTYPDERAFHGFCVRWRNLQAKLRVVK